MAEPDSPPGRAAQPVQPLPPAGAPPGDPSMEDILASIRRILNEDEAPPASPQGPPPLAGDEPLDLTREMLVGAPPAAPPPAPLPAAAPHPPPQAPAPPVPAEPPAASPPPALAPADALLAPAAVAAASASVGQLLRAVAAERSSAVRGGGPTIEDVVREELRPLLKEWLDRHLPAVVERLVRAEIERVVGRALS